MIKKSLSSHVAFILCLIGFAIYFGAISHIGRIPYSDSAMYASMIEGFFKTGKVDLIYYSQPPLLGMFPFVLPWISVFGMSNASLQWFNIIVFLVGATGLYVFALRYTKPIIATILCASLLCFGPVVENVPTFMTDILYTTEMIYFLLITQWLQDSYLSAPGPLLGNAGRIIRRRRALLWGAWGFLFVSAILIRSFIALIVPLLLVYMLTIRWKTRKHESQFARTAFLVSVPCLLIAGALYKAFTIHPMPLKAALIVDDLIDGHFKQFAGQLREPTIFVICTLLCLFPTALFLQNLRRPGKAARLGDIVVGTVVFLVGLATWRTGMFRAIGISSWDNIVLPVFVVLSTYAGLQFWRLFCDWSGQKSEAEFSAVRFLIVGSALAQYLTEHLMLVPFLRHFLPVFVSLILFCLPRLISDTRRLYRFVAACVFIAITATINFQVYAMTRKINVILSDTAAKLLARGIPSQDVFGGGHWYSNQYLKYGTHRVTFDENKRKLFYKGQDMIRYNVAYVPRNNLPRFLRFRYPWQDSWQVAQSPLPHGVIFTQEVAGFPDKAVVYIQHKKPEEPLE